MMRIWAAALPIAILGAGCAAPAGAADSAPAPLSMAAFFEPAAMTPKAPDADGFLQRWLLLEPVVKPNRSNAGFTGTYVRQALTTEYFPGQFTIVPRDGDKTKGKDPLQWHALDAKLFDVKLFNFAQGLGKPTYSPPKTS